MKLHECAILEQQRRCSQAFAKAKDLGDEG